MGFNSAGMNRSSRYNPTGDSVLQLICALSCINSTTEKQKFKKILITIETQLVIRETDLIFLQAQGTEFFSRYESENYSVPGIYEEK
jgi:hypothetical protein